jgi:hypothetical protein
MLLRRLLPLVAAALLVPAATAAAAPLNDDFGDAADLGGAAQVSKSFNLSGATTEPPFEPDHFTNDYGHTVWFKWTPTASGGVHVKACDNGSAKIKVYTGSSLTGLTTVPVGEGGTNGCDAWHRFMAVKGTTYRIVVDHWVGAVDYTGTVKVDQGTEKPVATFPGWPATTDDTFKSPLRTTTWNDPLDAMYGTFNCAIDNVVIYCDETGAYLKDLTHGQHTFKVRARDHYGNWQDGWSTRTWMVDAVAPTVTVASWTQTNYTDAPPLVTWQADEPNVTFTCRVDGGDPFSCTSPWQAPELALDTTHYLSIYAVDPYGNHAPAKSAKWAVLSPKQTTITTQPPTTTNTTTQATQTTPTTPPVVAPAGACAPVVRALTTSQRTIRRRGMRVRVANAADRSCTVELELRAGKRSLTRQVRPVAARGTLVVTLKPRVKVARTARIRLVSRAR